MQPMFYTIALLFLLPHTTHAHNDALAFALPIEGITIDGDLSDWPADLERYPVTHHMEGDSLQGVQDLQGQFRIGYNTAENTLYIAVEVQDDILIQDPLETLKKTPWSAQDGCEIYVDLMHPAGFTQQHTQYFQRGEHTGKSHRGQTGEFSGTIRWQVAGYHFEARLDLSAQAADSLKLQPGRILGFDLVLWDQDGKGTANRLIWGHGNENWPRSDQLGDLVLLHSPGDLATLTGHVVHAGNDIPHSGFPLRAYNRDLSVQLTADTSGQYRIDLPPATYWLRPSRDTPVQTLL